jgi:hypothetical protein
MKGTCSSLRNNCVRSEKDVEHSVEWCSDDKVLRKILGPAGDEVTKDWRRTFTMGSMIMLPYDKHEGGNGRTSNHAEAKRNTNTANCIGEVR